MYNDINKITDKAITLIDRHLTKLLEQGDVAGSSAVIIQNYTKVLLLVMKDQRDASKGFNPGTLTEDELEKQALQAERYLNESDNETD